MTYMHTELTLILLPLRRESRALGRAAHGASRYPRGAFGVILTRVTRVVGTETGHTHG